MEKVILNKCFGGFDVSDEGYQLYAKKKGLKLYKYTTEFRGKEYYYRKTNADNIFDTYFTKDFGDNVKISEEDYQKYVLYLSGDNYREDPTLIEVVEELGQKASGKFGNLIIVEIPENLNYVIDCYDGIETLHERVTEW